MKWYLNLTTRAKLLLSFGLMIGLLLIVIVAAYLHITALHHSQQVLYEVDFANAVELVELRSDMNRQRAHMLEMMLITEGSQQAALHREIEDRAKEIDGIMQQLVERNGSDPRFLQRLEELKNTLNQYRQTREREIALFEERTEEAQQLGLGIQGELFEKIRSITRELGDAAAQQAQRRIAQSIHSARNAIRFFAIVGVTALLVSTAMIVLLNRIMANPLREISGAAERIAVGDLTAYVASFPSRRDEVGALAQTFARMSQSLQQMTNVAEQIAAGNLTVKVEPQSANDVLGNAFATMVENLQRVTRDIREGVNVLAAAASEIMATTTQLAAGATETATAISQTATTAQEIKQASQVSSEKAKHVLESAQEAAEDSQRGQKAVVDSSEMMQRIREQMESIAETIVRLSEQSQSIGEITATVNDLTDQSNLLAVNAAIEAAKAGDQGKGFAVVAQEVKSLAEQSKQATAQVRTILSDIQKAVSSAVIVTERGSKAVDEGVQQIAAVGEAIRMLVDRITESAQAATQIAASSRQQSVGTDQMAMAMENIKQASVQNVASIKQAEVTAQSLHELGQQLKQLVEQYRV